jgi:hypothetical protein
MRDYKWKTAAMAKKIALKTAWMGNFKDFTKKQA